MSERDVLLDVSRLIWRLWRGRLPTGVDRVCLAYLDHYRSRSRAVVQRKGRYFVLTERHSDRLFDSLASGPKGFRRSMVQLGLRAFPAARRAPEKEGLIYLNVGHTGLDDPSLGGWIAEARVRAIFLIHDLIPLLHSKFCRPGEQAKHERRMENVLGSAAGLIANSEATAADIRAFARARGLAVPPIVVALLGTPKDPANVEPRRFDRPHFVTVGTIEGRKNHVLLLNLWRRLATEGHSAVPILVIVGQRGWEAECAIEMLDHAHDLEGHVVELDQCADDELAAIITGARALLMPSFAEGFGLPVMEALELGTPVIASDLAVFREFAGDLPTYLDPADELAWERAIDALAGDSPEREQQLQRIRGYRAPDWNTHFDTVDPWIGTLVQ
ncbi:MAG: glycosyltransferase family 4 protein [Sphingomonas sp.]|nr:glycosyltransferase family 4 protein [Sphingomonas sp.]